MKLNCLAIHMHHIIMEELGLKLLNNLSVSNNSEFSCNLSTTCMTCIVVTILSCALHVCTCTLGVMTTLSIFRFPFQLSVSSVYTCPKETWKQYVWQQRLYFLIHEQWLAIEQYSRSHCIGQKEHAMFKIALRFEVRRTNDHAQHAHGVPIESMTEKRSWRAAVRTRLSSTEYDGSKLN